VQVALDFTSLCTSIKITVALDPGKSSAGLHDYSVGPLDLEIFSDDATYGKGCLIPASKELA
jgi:hypothetical protein